MTKGCEILLPGDDFKPCGKPVAAYGDDGLLVAFPLCAEHWAMWTKQGLTGQPLLVEAR